MLRHLSKLISTDWKRRYYWHVRIPCKILFALMLKGKFRNDKRPTSVSLILNFIDHSKMELVAFTYKIFSDIFQMEFGI